MAQKTLITCAVAAVLAVAANAQAEDSTTGPFGFQPIAESATSAGWDPTAPWVIPEGFKQSVVSDETDLNIYHTASMPYLPTAANRHVQF